MSIHKTEMTGVYTLFEPKEYSLPLLVDSPHSGRTYPQDFDYACDFKDLQPTEDNHLDILLQSCLLQGATLLQCEFPRCYIDVNRAIDDIDEALFKNLENVPINPTPRSSAGYGLIRRLVRPGLPLYDHLLDYQDAQHRIDAYYLNYHNILEQKLDALHYNFGQVWYINMHSMPSSSAHTEDGHPVDFVLGDRHGTTCRKDFIQSLKHYLESLGYRVSLNDPYKGVELIQRHGQPYLGKNALQIEINKNLYWHEKTQEFLPRFKKLESDIALMFSFIAEFVEKELVLKAAD